jgi:predicted Rossmann fold flavoprotein
VPSKAEIRTGCSAARIEKENVFEVNTSNGDFRSASLVVACGGLSFPKIGASDFGYTIARQFDIKIEETRPSLVAMQFKDNSDLTALSGLSIDALVSLGKIAFHENILVTHRGLSGPAILQISNYWQKGQPVTIDLLAGKDAVAILKENRQRRISVANVISQYLPQRFVDAFALQNFPDKTLDQISTKRLQTIADRLNNWNVQFRATEGYDRAEVTLGGVSTSELSSKTMESKRVQACISLARLST